jgi:hypothetical protein
MMQGESMRTRYACIILGTVLTIVSCSGVEVMITQNRYTPSFDNSSYAQYKNKPVLLSGFTNLANDTFMWGFQSQDRGITYKSEWAVLESLLWYSYQKGLRSIGMAVYDLAYPLGTPELSLTLLSMNDQSMKYKVKLLKDGLLLDKEYTVQLPPVRTSNHAELEQRVYQLIDMSLTTVLNDVEFSREFL